MASDDELLPLTLEWLFTLGIITLLATEITLMRVWFVCLQDCLQDYYLPQFARLEHAHTEPRPGIISITNNAGIPKV